MGSIASIVENEARFAFRHNYPDMSQFLVDSSIIPAIVA